MEGITDAMPFTHRHTFQHPDKVEQADRTEERGDEPLVTLEDSALDVSAKDAEDDESPATTTGDDDG